MVTSQQLRVTMDTVLSKAAHEALWLNHGIQEPGHLLLGLLNGPDHPARNVLLALGFNLDKARGVVRKCYPKVDGSQFIDAFSTDSLSAIEHSTSIAQRHASTDVSPRAHHLSIALIDEKDAVVLTVFNHFNVTPENFLRRLDMELADE